MQEAFFLPFFFLHLLRGGLYNIIPPIYVIVQVHIFVHIVVYVKGLFYLKRGHEEPVSQIAQIGVQRIYDITPYQENPPIASTLPAD